MACDYWTGCSLPTCCCSCHSLSFMPPVSLLASHLFWWKGSPTLPSTWHPQNAYSLSLLAACLTPHPHPLSLALSPSTFLPLFYYYVHIYNISNLFGRDPWFTIGSSCLQFLLTTSMSTSSSLQKYCLFPVFSLSFFSFVCLHFLFLISILNLMSLTQIQILTPLILLHHDLAYPCFSFTNLFLPTLTLSFIFSPLCLTPSLLLLSSHADNGPLPPTLQRVKLPPHPLLCHRQNGHANVD